MSLEKEFEPAEELWKGDLLLLLGQSESHQDLIYELRDVHDQSVTFSKCLSSLI